MQYRLVLHMAMVLSVEGVPIFTCWGFLPVLFLCTLFQPPEACVALYIRICILQGCRGPAMGNKQANSKKPWIALPGSTLEEVACSLRS